MQRLNDLPDVAIMGVLNVTPDSFSDGGEFHESETALRQALRMRDEGASIIDVGGESTRPGADPVTEQQELDRVIPVVERLADELGILISVDTSKPGVMREAVSAGAGMINDVRALREAGALQAAASLDCPVCLMHMQGQPKTMQENPGYVDVVSDVAEFLNARIVACEAAGIRRDAIVIDPGYGFGKTPAQNLELLRRQGELAALGCPILAGWSRKSTLGVVTGREVDARLPASIVAAAVAVQNGARIVRVHDVAETLDAVRMVIAIRDGI